MTARIVRLGSPRQAGEGTRIGTVRRPPRGVPKAQFSSHDWYDVWFPLLAPSAPLVKEALAATTPLDLAAFVRKYKGEMAASEESWARFARASSHSADFSVGCYCADESRCHRSILRELLVARGAKVA